MNSFVIAKVVLCVSRLRALMTPRFNFTPLKTAEVAPFIAEDVESRINTNECRKITLFCRACNTKGHKSGDPIRCYKYKEAADKYDR